MPKEDGDVEEHKDIADGNSGDVRLTFSLNFVTNGTLGEGVREGGSEGRLRAGVSEGGEIEGGREAGEEEWEV